MPPQAKKKRSTVMRSTSQAVAEREPGVINRAQEMIEAMSLAQIAGAVGVLITLILAPTLFFRGPTGPQYTENQQGLCRLHMSIQTSVPELDGHATAYSWLGIDYTPGKDARPTWQKLRIAYQQTTEKYMESWSVSRVVSQKDATKFLLTGRVYAMLSDDVAWDLYERGLKENVWQDCQQKMGIR